MKRITPALVVTLLVPLIASCAGSMRTSRNDSDPERVSVGTQTSLHTSSDAADLDKGIGFISSGDYGQAETYLKRASKSTKEGTRNEALFQLGVLYSQLLNPRKDYAKAKASLESVLSSNPEPELRARAEERLESVEKLIEAAK